MPTKLIINNFTGFEDDMNTDGNLIYLELNHFILKANIM
jgi:hypothetical protein